jgi:hypothetical protein
VIADLNVALPGEGLLPEHQDLINRYTAVIDLVEVRYGPEANSVTVVTFEFLAALHELVVGADGGLYPGLSAVIDGVAERTIARYRRLVRMDALLPREIVDVGPERYRFDRGYFDGRYAATARAVASDVVVLDADALRTVTAGRVYLYVLDCAGRFVIYRHPMLLLDMFHQVNPRFGEIEVCHPMLVPESLTALAAGELVLFGDAAVGAAIASLKSGHFRPTRQSLPVLRAALERTFPELRLATLLPVDLGVGAHPAAEADG